MTLAGLWVAISPWFLTLQAGVARNATTSDLITGLAVAILRLLALTAARGTAGLQAARPPRPCTSRPVRRSGLC